MHIKCFSSPNPDRHTTSTSRWGESAGLPVPPASPLRRRGSGDLTLLRLRVRLRRVRLFRRAPRRLAARTCGYWESGHVRVLWKQPYTVWTMWSIKDLMEHDLMRFPYIVGFRAGAVFGRFNSFTTEEGRCQFITNVGKRTRQQTSSPYTSQTRPVWDCQDGLPPQTDPPNTHAAPLVVSRHSVW